MRCNKPLSPHILSFAYLYEPDDQLLIAGRKVNGQNTPYAKMVFQPMLEVLAYLRADGSKTCIVSGGRLDKGLDEAKAKGWTVVDMINKEKAYGFRN